MPSIPAYKKFPLLCILIFAPALYPQTFISDDYTHFTPNSGQGERTISNDTGTLDVVFTLPFLVYKKHHIILSNNSYTKAFFESNFNLTIQNNNSTINAFDLSSNKNFTLENTSGTIDKLTIMQEGQFHLENKATLQNIALNANATLTLNSTSPIISITQTKGKMSLAGSVTNYTQSGGELHLQSGTITTLTSAGNSSVEIEQGGTLSSLTLGDSGVLNLKNKGSLKKAKNSGTLILREGGLENLEQKNGHLQNHAKIEKLEASGGRIDNLGYISSLNAQSGDTFIKNQSDINSVSLSSGRLNFHNAGRVLGDFKIGGSSTLHLNTLQGIAERGGIAQITITQGNPTIIIENLQVQTQAGIPSTVVSFLNAQGTSPKYKSIR